MKQNEHGIVRISVRPPRITVAYCAEFDWQFNARHALTSLAGTWGGLCATLLPTISGRQVTDSLLPFLRVYDPDHIATSNPTLGDLEEIHPDIISRHAASHFEFPMTAQVYEQYQEITTSLMLDDTLVDAIDQWCSPFTGLHQSQQQFKSSDVTPFESGAISIGGASPLPANRSDVFYNIRLQDSDPTLQLLIESVLGYLRGTGRTGRNVVDIEVSHHDAHRLITAVISGSNIASSTAWLEGIKGENVFHATPFAPQRQNLSRVSNGLRSRSVCVIGDAPEDHALALICDRIFSSGRWIPRSTLDRNDALGAAARTALSSMIWSSSHNDSPCAIVSTSESHDYLSSFAPLSGQATIDEVEIKIPKRAEVLTLDELAAASQNSSVSFADSKSFDTRRGIQLVREDGEMLMAAPLQLPLPRDVEDGHDLTWCTDVRLPRYQLPARTAIRSSTLGPRTPGNFPEAQIRASRYGISFSSQRLGFVPAGASMEGRTANPLLQFISALQTFSELAQKSGASITPSSAGKRAYNVVQQWGGFEALTADLHTDTRALLEAFSPPPGRHRTGSYENGYSIRGIGYLSFADAATALGANTSRTKEVLDRLISSDVLTRGLILGCDRCEGKHHYNLDHLGRSNFHCNLCGHENQLMSSRWGSNDSEPAWTYGLAYIVRELLEQHGDVPLLACAELIKEADTYMWSPELALRYSDGSSVELDICMIIDGQILIGEAKSTSRISGRGKNPTRTANSLVRAAQTLSADSIVLATSQEAWNPSVATAIEASLAELAGSAPIPNVQYLTSVGQHTADRGPHHL